ncbi:MAG: ABC transporter permease [Tannerella sp.]|nr:ABC transporter permease [Tannerella sp.]
MKRMQIIRKSRHFYRPYYRMTALAVMITVAVVTGSLMIGESVRSTLVRRVHERLGNTESILFGRYTFFHSQLADEALFEKKARAVLLSDGFVRDAGRLLPVQVWGMDDKTIPEGGIFVNRALKKELSLSEGEDLVLRLPATGLTPSGSLFVTGNYTTEARLTLKGIIEANDGGNINLKNEQIIPYNIFINRKELASVLDVEGKANLLLSDKKITYDELNSVWTPDIAGIQIREQDDFTELVSDRVFIQPEAVQALCRDNPGANRLFSYLTNSICSATGCIPYSFVTAMDNYKGRELGVDEIILSDYSARRLNAELNDRICFTYYYTTGHLKTLHVDTLWGRVAGIVPLSELVADSGLSADFPGLSGVERCTEWDSDLPIDMSLITAEDEDYWSLYRSTPKAILPYKAVGNKWSSAYGSATALRFTSPPDSKGLDAAMFGLQLIDPREAGLDAAHQGVDFASLFLALGFFIILSALLLLLVPLSEMICRRRDEITLLVALGYTRKRIAGLLWSESLTVILGASTVGVVAGILYTWIILILLESLWKGATHTDGFILFPSLATIAAGWAAGTVVSLIVVPLGIRRILKSNTPTPEKDEEKVPFGVRPLKMNVNVSITAVKKISPNIWRIIKRSAVKTKQGKSPRHSLRFAWLGTFFCFIALIAGIRYRSTAFFMVTGLLLMFTAAFAGNYLICSRGAPSMPLSEKKWVWSSLLANRERVWLSFFTLATGVFLVFAVGLNRKGFSNSSQLFTATGGYTLWCETTVPIYYNLSTQEGRDKMALSGLPTGTEILQLSRYGADDAGCLNLHRVSQPSVLGVDMQAIQNSGFRLLQSIRFAEDDPFAALQKTVPDAGLFASSRVATAGHAYPVLIDETVLTWSLMRKLGDTVHYDTGDRTISLLLAGTLDNTVFQGHLLMDIRLFSKIWSEAAGSEILLFKTGENEIDGVKKLVEQALNEYGVRVSTTAGRLQEFNSVTDTYLTIFLTLGGLGLLLGIAGFIIVLRKELASRKEQIILYRALGFSNLRIASLLIAENRMVPLYAIGAGSIGALAGVSVGVAHISASVALPAITLALLLIICVAAFIRKSVYTCLSEKLFV